MSTARSQRRREVKRRYAQPCRGYVSSQAKDMVGPGVFTGASTSDSYNCTIDSKEQHVVRRRGEAYYIETDPTAQAGLLEAVTKNLSMNMLARHMLDVQYPSATPGSIVGPTALYTDRDDTGHFGALYVLTSTQGTRKTLGHEMGTIASPGTTHYPRDAAASLAQYNFHMIPLPYMAGGSGTQATGYNRCTFPLMRALLCGGAMKMMQAADHLLVPSIHGTPMKWDRRSNPSTSTGSDVSHIGPWGHIPPLFAPVISTANASTGTNDQIWWDGDQFYISVVFEMDDGSYSAPFQPRQGGFLTTPNGLVTVGSTSGNAAYKSLTMVGVAIGPPGTRARHLCRTRKTNISTTATRPTGMTPLGATSDIDAAGRKLYVFARIGNNTQTTYEMTESNDDSSLIDDPIIIRNDVIWPLPARHCFEIERRAAIGYTRKQGLCAIVLAPTATTGQFDLNSPDDTVPGFNTPYGAYAYCWRLVQDTAGVLTLYNRRSAIGLAGIAGFSTIIGATTTIQDMIDYINLDLLTGGILTRGEWAAQPAPGCNPNLLASYLAPTVVQASGCTLAASPTIAGGNKFVNVAIGMRVRLTSGTGSVPANAVVIAKASDSSITVGDENGTPQNGTAGTATLEFWSDTGDDGYSTDTATWGVGNVRSFCGAFPSIIALKGSYVDSLGFDKSGIMFTGASPGAAPLAPQSFFLNPANRARGPTDAGVFMGGAPVFPHAIAYFSEQTYVLQNTKDFNTGDDRDFVLRPLGPRGRGCIQYGTIVFGSGWAGALTREGFIVTDARFEKDITGALLNPAHGGTGILTYHCQTLAALNGVADLPRYQTAHAYVVDGTIRLSFQPNAVAA